MLRVPWQRPQTSRMRDSPSALERKRKGPARQRMAAEKAESMDNGHRKEEQKEKETRAKAGARIRATVYTT